MAKKVVVVVTVVVSGDVDGVRGKGAAHTIGGHPAWRLAPNASIAVTAVATVW